MSVTVNNLGANSKQIVIANELGPANIIAAIDTALVALGWTAYDSVTSGSRNCLLTNVYRSLNKDGSTYKYLIIRYDAPRGFYYTSCAEGWNNVTHVATNECYTFNRALPMSLQSGNNTLYLFANSHYAIFFNVVRGEPGPWQGVVEWEREASDDTVANGYPCFGWVNSATIGAAYSTKSPASNTCATPYCVSVPRTRNGYTGGRAAYEMVFNTSFGMFPPNISTSAVYGANVSGGINSTVNAFHAMLSAFGNGMTYAWDAGKKIVGSLRLTGIAAHMPTGRLFGMKVIPNTGNILDTVQLPVDADGFFSAAGSNLNHFILGMHGGCFTDQTVAANRLASTTYNTGPSSIFAQASAVILRGRYVYAGTIAGSLVKLDLDTGAWATISSGHTSVISLAYDGNQYLYFSTTSGVSRLNIADDSITNLTAGTGGCSLLALDDTYLYATHRTASTTPKIDIITLATFTVTRTYTPTAFTSSYFWTGLDTADYKGFAYTYMCGSATAADEKFCRVAGADAVGSLVALPNPTASETCHGMVWDGTSIYIFKSTTSTPTAVTCFDPVSLSYTTSAQMSGIPFFTANNNNYSYGGKGVPVKGFWFVPHAISNDFYTGFAGKSSGLTTGSTTESFYTSCTTLAIGGGLSPLMVSDGCSFYAGESPAKFGRLTGLHGNRICAGNLAASIILPA